MIFFFYQEDAPDVYVHALTPCFVHGNIHDLTLLLSQS